MEFVSGTKPIAQDEIEKIIDTAYAAQLLGMKLVYLECGSGARFSVKEKIIERVSSVLDIPLIVGGGIKSRKEILGKHEAGADIVVVGTALEHDPTILLKTK